MADPRAFRLPRGRGIASSTRREKWSGKERKVTLESNFVFHDRELVFANFRIPDFNFRIIDFINF